TLPELPRCPRCEKLLRPDVVWFHEMLPAGAWHEACEQTESCDCFLVIGTSAQVYPAAGLIRTARGNRASVLEFNLERTAASALADVSLLGPSGDLLPQVLQRI
ncbi:MAG: SIR2 family NAD-dependent protein deacylase, partial [Gemmataceae bacterium]